MSDRPDMIPRITVRDADDAELVLRALRTSMHLRMTELEREARMASPGSAKQYELTLKLMTETKNVTDLMTVITDNLSFDNEETE